MALSYSNGRTSSRRRCAGIAALLFVLCAVAASQTVCGQAPALAWSANLGGRLFAVDAQTNIYANAGGTVFKLNDSGVPLQTNALCPLPGVARRDSAGNFYFAGSFDGTQNFGGITLVGGWTNNPMRPSRWTPGWPTCFAAKYAGNGTLQWVVSFGDQSYPNALTSLALDPNGACYAGYGATSRGTSVAHLSSAGSVDWTWNSSDWSFYGAMLGGVTSSNCCLLRMLEPSASLARLSSSGSGAGLGQHPLNWPSLWGTNSEPVIDDQGNAYQVGKCSWFYTGCTNATWLRKCGQGTDLWIREITPVAEGTLARDAQGNVYVGGSSGFLGKYSSNGDVVWTNYFAQAPVAMVVDASGNRFVSFADGSVGRLQDDGTPQPPQITSGPVDQTVFAGDTLTLTVAAVGTAPLAYAWRLNGATLPGATAAQLSLNPIAASQAGTYSVVVTNLVAAVTSAPATLRVKSVQLYQGSTMLTNGSYIFASPPTLKIRSAFAGGSSFYTLDGSAPTKSSIPYTGPFVLEHNATVRAIGYSADGLQSEEADAITATVFSQHTLTATVSGQGSVLLDPPGGTYANTTTVTLKAVPAPGWSFLFWLDSVTGSDPTATLSMEYDRYVLAVFGTNVSTALGAPGLAWSSSLGGRLFAVDAQTNVYANAGGTIFKLNANGAPLQTNAICPLPGVARRDSAGNYYFAGSFDGTQNFGGITLVGGWTNSPMRPGRWIPNWPTCLAAKYAGNGTLQWVISFGGQGCSNVLTSLALDPNGACYAGYGAMGYGTSVAHVSSAGSMDWTWNASSDWIFVGAMLGGVTSSNCCLLRLMDPSAVLVYLSSSGNSSSLGQAPLNWSSPWCTNTEPVMDDQGNAYQVGKCPPWFYTGCTNATWLRKCGQGTDLWIREITPEAEGTLARDAQGNVYVGGSSGFLGKYSSNGDVVWTNYFAQAPVAMVVDASGNRFVSFADGSVGRLQDDAASGTGFGVSQSQGTGGGVAFSLVSQPAQVWQIQISTNLTAWQTLGLVTNTSGGIQFRDPSSRTIKARFYRAVPWP